MKYKSIIFLVALSALLAACKGGSTTTISDKAVINGFYVLSSKDNNIKKRVFTISEVDHMIYNVDSLPYYTDIDSLSPIITPQFYTAYIDDTISVYAFDTVWVDFRHDRMLTVTASDQTTKATYRVRVNRHQVDPDSFVWRVSTPLPDIEGNPNKALMADDRLVWLVNAEGELSGYESTDGSLWQQLRTDGLPADGSALDIDHAVAVAGEICISDGSNLYTSNKGLGWTRISTTTTGGETFGHLLFSLGADLYAVSREGHVLRLNGSEWRVAAEVANFPVEGEAVCKGLSPTGTERVFVVGGIDAAGNYLEQVLSSENGLYWVNLTHKRGYFTPRAHAAVAQYGSGLLMIGGTTADSLVADNYLYSRDYGMTWMRVDTAFEVDTLLIPQYTERTHASLLAPGDGRLFLLGGRTVQGYVGELWRGVQYASLPGFKR